MQHNSIIRFFIERSWLSSFVLACLIGSSAYLLTYFSYRELISFYTLTPRSLAVCMTGESYSTSTAQCLEHTIHTLLNTYSTKQLMMYVSASTSPEALKNKCHSIGHIIGKVTYDRIQTAEGALLQCSSVCRFACEHGVIGESVRSLTGGGYDDDIAHVSQAEIEKVGKKYCKDGQLCHAIGHVLYMRNSNVNESTLRGCTDVSRGFSREACYQGIFMQRMGGSDALDSFEARPAFEMKPDDYTYPCLSIPLQYRHACFQYLPKYQEILLTQSGTTSSKMPLSISQKVCEGLNTQERAWCFEGIGVQSENVFSVLRYSARKMQKFCNQFSTFNDRTSCTIGMIPHFFFLSDPSPAAISYCNRIYEPDRKTICYMALFQNLGDAASSTRSAKACDAVASCKDAQEKFVASAKGLPDYRFGLFGRLK